MNKFEISKSGLYCMWESGGAYTNTGSSSIITDCVFKPKRALFIKTRGNLACGVHALIPIEVDDKIIEVIFWDNYGY